MKPRELQGYQELQDLISHEGRLTIMSEMAWKSKVGTHPYPRVDIDEGDKPVIRCRIAEEKTYKGKFFVDAGTGRRFRGSFPMVPVRLLDPMGNQNLSGHKELVQAAVAGFYKHLTTGSRTVEKGIVVPFLVSSLKSKGVIMMHQLWFYGAYADDAKECRTDPYPFRIDESIGVYWNTEQTARKGDSISFVLEAGRMWSLESQEDANEKAWELCCQEVNRPIFEPLRDDEGED